MTADDRQAVADALAALDPGDHADLTLADHDEPITVFVRDLAVDHDGLAGVAERTVTLETLDGETLRVVLQLANRPDATVELSHAVLGEDPEDCEYVRIQAVADSSQQTLVPDGGVDVDSVETQPHRPEVVCLCGSTRFKEQYRAENRRLTMAGKIVLSVGLFGHADGVDLSDAEKEMLDSLHKRKIDLADRIHVINVDGYIGESTRSEIEYARATDTDVSYLEAPVPDGGVEHESEQFRKSGVVENPTDAFGLVQWLCRALLEGHQDRFGRRYHVDVVVNVRPLNTESTPTGDGE